MKYTCIDENGKSVESTKSFAYYKRYGSYKDFIKSEKILEKIKQVKSQKLDILNKEQTLKMWTDKNNAITNLLKEAFTSIDNPAGTTTQVAKWTSISNVPVLVAYQETSSVSVPFFGRTDTKEKTRYYNVSIWYNVNGKLKNRVIARAKILIKK